MSLPIFGLILILISNSYLGSVSAHVSRQAQDDPVVQCAEGVRAYLDGRTAEAWPLLEAGFAGRDTAEFANLDDLGRCSLALGILLGSAGNLTRALEASAVALETFKGSGNRQLEGKTLNNIGAVYRNSGRYREALKAYEEALVVWREVDDRASDGTTLNNIGAVYFVQGRYGEALLAYQQALAIAREVDNRAGEGMVLNNIGGVYDSQGRYTTAIEIYHQALAIQQEVGDRVGAGDTLNDIGGAYSSQRHYGETLETFQQALAILREVGDRAGEGTVLNNIGKVYHSQGRYAEALEALDQALAIAREVGDRPVEGTVLNNIGGVYDSQGRYAEALEALEQALLIRRVVGDQAGEGTTLSNIGMAYSSQGRHEEALRALERALAMRRTVRDRPGEGITLDNIGKVYFAQGRYDKALTKYEESMMVLEALRAGAGSEAGRAGFIAQYADLYTRAVEPYHSQGQDAAAFLTSERGRSRAFLDSLATGYVELSDDAAADLLAREQETYAVRQAAQDALAKAHSLDPPNSALVTALVTDLETQLAAAEQEHQAALDAITARGGQLAALVPGRSSVLDLAAVQALLDDQTTLVSYWVLDDKGALAFVITGDSFTTVELPDATSANLASAVDNTLSWLNREQAHPKPLRDLYTWLVAPLAEHLQTPQVVIVPHQELQYVPFAALDDGQTYFGQQHLLSVIPSASALPFIQQNAAESAAMANTQALVFGNPSTGDPKYPSLAHAAAEAQAVASLLGTAAVTDAEASETRLRKEAAGSKVIHLAAHGGYNVANPLYSAIYLAPGGEGAAGDGRLETHEVYGLDLKGNELVVLSACQTNVGELSAGDELVGMTRAFLFAGTPTILSSLWSVDDEATAALMTAFYRHWQAGMGKAEALQAAQAEVRANPRWASPFYWAGFALNGDPGANTVKVSEPAAQPAESLTSSQPTTSTAPQQPDRSLLPVLLVIGTLALGLAVLTVGWLRRRSSANRQGSGGL